MDTNSEKSNELKNVDQNSEHARQDDQDVAVKENLSFKGKICNIYRNITVEPYIYLVMTATTLHTMASHNLGLEKACRVNLNFSTEICDSLMRQDGEAHSDYERATQQLLASTFVWRTYITATITCIVALLIGSFSDKTGYRKFFLIVPTTGHILSGINSIIQVYFFYQTSLEALVISGAVIDGLSGGYCVIMMTCFAYISAITTDADRTFRVGVLAFCVALASPVGWALSGVSLNALGYYGVNAIFILLNAIAILYTIFSIIDPKKSPKQEEHSNLSRCKLFCSFFNMTNAIDALKLLIKKAPNSRRVRLSILLLMVVVLFGSASGENSIMYLSVRYRFQWNEIQFSLFQSFNLFTNLLGTVLTILLFIKYFGIHDSMLGIISILTRIAALCIYCFAQTGPIFYIGPVIDIMNGMSMVALRSIMSKMVEDQEIGKLSSLIGIVENLSPLIYIPLYAKVYAATMDVLPGAVFLVGGLLMVPALAVLCYLFYEHRKQLRQSQSTESQI